MLSDVRLFLFFFQLRRQMLSRLFIKKESKTGLYPTQSHGALTKITAAHGSGTKVQGNLAKRLTLALFH